MAAVRALKTAAMGAWYKAMARRDTPMIPAVILAVHHAVPPGRPVETMEALRTAEPAMKGQGLIIGAHPRLRPRVATFTAARQGGVAGEGEAGGEQGSGEQFDRF